MERSINKLFLLIITLLASSVFAQNLDSLQRQTPSGQYIDPASFFRFHGYITLTYAQPGKDLGGQILVSGQHPITKENNGGFKNDAALFVGGEPIDGVGSVLELHFVGNAMDPVITEAKILVHLIDSEDGGNYNLRLVAGRYWWPFGIHNDEWFSAINNFNLVSPAAIQVVPTHYNEVGMAAEGEISFSENLGGNYVLSIGNGVSSFKMPDVVGSAANTYDYDDNRTITARGGLIYSNNGKYEAGFSYSSGTLREGVLPTSGGITDPRNFNAEFTAMGADFRVGLDNGLGLRSYYYMSDESLTSAPVSSLKRDGATVEPFYNWSINTGWFETVQLHARYGFANEETFGGDNEWKQMGAGINFHLKGKLSARFGYLVQEEGGILTEGDNDIFSFSLTSEF